MKKVGTYRVKKTSWNGGWKGRSATISFEEKNIVVSAYLMRLLLLVLF